MAEWGTGWISGSCAAGAWPLGNRADDEAAGAESTASYPRPATPRPAPPADLLMISGHQPLAPLWNCARCLQAWPCVGARVELTSRLSPSSLAQVMAMWMGAAAADLGDPRQLFDRFLLWTRPDDLGDVPFLC